ncbi:unnamed protein product [Rotaria magnacalcarata]|uniref:Uncharacterized protein n=2 Tax=Rotaria magnacalcarata TaxID=392030 RepID=A0A8S2MNG3_9BILA|nr:unnamed protein product [Rotaria magnacalcarata]CAF3962082.1 unnamed protein product [Rotaria magnacalcarata]
MTKRTKQNSDSDYSSNDIDNLTDNSIESDESLFEQWIYYVILSITQLSSMVESYTQSSPVNNYSIVHQGCDGTNESISSSLSTSHSSLAFVYSIFERPKEVYLVENINDLQTAEAITNDNELCTQRDLPQAKIYQWTRDEDKRSIEGILHYPPGKYESKSLPIG